MIVISVVLGLLVLTFAVLAYLVAENLNRVIFSLLARDDDELFFAEDDTITTPREAFVAVGESSGVLRVGAKVILSVVDRVDRMPLGRRLLWHLIDTLAVLFGAVGSIVDLLAIRDYRERCHRRFQRSFIRKLTRQHADW
jgi:hypothetical protein